MQSGAPQLICELETSKAVMEIHAPEAGIVLYVAAVGDELPIGSVICEIIPETRAEQKSTLAPTKVESKRTSADEPSARFTLLARKIAAEYSLDPLPAGDFSELLVRDH